MHSPEDALWKMIKKPLPSSNGERGTNEQTSLISSGGEWGESVAKA